MPHAACRTQSSKLETSAAAGNDDGIILCYYPAVSFYGVNFFRLF
jgi:hypothetical protein